MLKVKNLGIFAIIALTCGLTPAVSCIKTGNRAQPLVPPATDSLAGGNAVHSYLALGDSYTIGQSVSVSDRYPVQVLKILEENHIYCNGPEIIATTGWTTVDLLSALKNKTVPSPPYSVVTLLIGVNDQFQGSSPDEYRQHFTTLLQQSIQLAGNLPSHVIVLSIPDYSVTPYARDRNTALIASQIDSFNVINLQVSMANKVNYLDITGDSRMAGSDPSLIASDSLHFSGKEYTIWADKMEPIMEGMLK